MIFFHRQSLSVGSLSLHCQQQSTFHGADKADELDLLELLHLYMNEALRDERRDLKGSRAEEDPGGGLMYQGRTCDGSCLKARESLRRRNKTHDPFARKLLQVHSAKALVYSPFLS